MQLTHIFVPLLAAGSALAFPRVDSLFKVKRDLNTIQGEIQKVQTALGDLDTAVKALSTDPNTAGPVLTASQNVESAIKTATTNIQNTDGLGLTDALQLQQIATGLTDSVQTTVNDLVDKKPVLDQLGVTSIALQSIQSQKTQSEALGKAIVSKVPAIGQGIAQQSIQQISDVLDGGIQKLSAGGGAAASPAAPAGSSAAPAESSAAPAESSAAPAESSAAPAKGSAAPAEGSAAPAKSSAAPAEGSAAPAESSAAGTTPPAAAKPTSTTIQSMKTIPGSAETPAPEASKPTAGAPMEMTMPGAAGAAITIAPMVQPNGECVCQVA